MTDLICLTGAAHMGGMVRPAVPSDKSLSHRILLLAMLEPEPTRIEGLNMGEAITPLLDAMRQLGVSLQFEEDGAVIVGTLQRTAPNRPPVYLNLGSSSAAARMLIGVLAGLGLEAIVDGDETLRPRPVDWVVDPLRELGARIDYLAGDAQLPVHVHPSVLHDGAVTLHVGSAQALSAVLYAACAARTRVTVTQRVRSRDHTQRLMQSLGDMVHEQGDQVHFVPGPRVALRRYTVPTDPSAVVYPIVAHLLSENAAELCIENVCLNPTRTGMLELLRQAGAPIRYVERGSVFGEPLGDVVLSGSAKLAPLRLDSDALFHAMIDEVPLAIALATQIEGRSVFNGLGELTFKETNRITSSAAMMAAFGAQVQVNGDTVWVEGRQRLQAHSTVPSFADHRLAMSAATLGVALQLVPTITQGSCYRTSFPEFATCLRGMGYALVER